MNKFRLICSSFTRVLTHMIKYYSFPYSEHISERNQDDLFIIHDSSNIHDEILFFSQSHLINKKIQNDSSIIHESSHMYDEILFFP